MGKTKKLVLYLFSALICVVVLAFLIFSGDKSEKKVNEKVVEKGEIAVLPVLSQDNAGSSLSPSFNGGFYEFFGSSQNTDGETPQESMPTLFLPETEDFISLDEWEKLFVKGSSGYKILSEEELMDMGRVALEAIVKPEAEQPVFRMSDEEYFEKAYPDSYREALNYLQDFLVEGNFISAGQKIIFKTEEDTYVFFSLLGGVMSRNGYLREITLEDYKNGIEELKKLNVIDRVFVEKRLLGANIDDLLVRAKKIVLNLIGLERADAVIWVTYIDCYKSTGAGGPLGINLMSYCCNCGWFCSYGCQYYQDCGYQSASCNVPNGCLNLMCRAYSAAIWDPMTGICGCG